jgi:hypothetical protein
MRITVRLPPQVYDDSLGHLLSQLGQAAQTASVVVVDFQDVQFYTPAALVTLLAAVDRWMHDGRTVEFANIEASPSFSYLQRMDFFALSGIDLAEKFTRHSSSGRFVPLQPIDEQTKSRVGPVCSELARCVFPDQADLDDPGFTGPHDLLEHAASELINNVIQHARGRGYVAAQVYPASGLVRLAVADCGIGIRQSFEETAPPFWDPKMSDLDAVRTALQPRASSKTHLPMAWGQTGNAGVGLSILKEVARHADGLFTLISGNGFHQHNHHERRRFPTEFNLLHRYAGTICALQLSQQKLGNLQQILQSAKQGIGLLQPDRRFDPLFE